MARGVNAVQVNDPTTEWESRTSASKRNLTLKKIAVSIIGLANCAGLGIALYYVISYCPVPTQAILASPFIVGVLAALKHMKFPTLGMTVSSYKSDLNPTTIAGKGIAYLFFGPLMLAVNNMDWTPYHDPINARVISETLETKEFAEISKEYGKNFSNLFSYKFLPITEKKGIDELHKECEAAQKLAELWTKNPVSAEKAKAEEKIKGINERWTTLKNQKQISFPKPKLPEYDLTKWTHRVKLWWREVGFFKPASPAAAN